METLKIKFKKKRVIWLHFVNAFLLILLFLSARSAFSEFWKDVENFDSKNISLFLTSLFFFYFFSIRHWISRHWLLRKYESNNSYEAEIPVSKIKGLSIQGYETTIKIEDFVYFIKPWTISNNHEINRLPEILPIKFSKSFRIISITFIIAFVTIQFYSIWHMISPYI